MRIAGASSIRGLVLALAIASSLQAQPAARTGEQYCVSGTRPCPLYQPSLITLLANPDLFEGKRVRVIGFMHLEFEGTAIYVRRDDYENGLSKNGFWVSFRDSTVNPLGINDRYVMLEGRFTARSAGHLGMWSGEIRDISFVRAWPGRAEVDTLR